MCFLKSGIIKIGLFWGVKEGPWKMIFRHVQKVQVLVIEFTFNKGSFGVVFFFLHVLWSTIQRAYNKLF